MFITTLSILFIYYCRASIDICIKVFFTTKIIFCKKTMDWGKTVHGITQINSDKVIEEKCAKN